jgi:hypothetical protein
MAKLTNEFGEYEVAVMVMKCLDCAALGLGFRDQDGGQRISDHKCSGKWENLKV